MSAPTQVHARAATLGDDELRALYAEHAQPLLRFVCQLTGDRQHAEDVVQETMLRAWQHPEAAAPERGSLRPWLHTVARRIVIDKVRARGSRPTEVVAQPHLTGNDDGGLDRSLLARDVAAALAKLSPEHREAILEAYYRERTLAESARTLGVPVGTVKSRIYYGLRALRLAMEEMGYPSLTEPLATARRQDVGTA